jgi:hypothetical protein
MSPAKGIGLLFLVLLLSQSSSQEKSRVYDFPIKGGTKEWKAFQTHEEMLNAVQIPDNILKSMNTEDLVQTCLNYPLFPDMWAFSNLQKGFEQVHEGFNGLQELFKRDAVCDILIARYESMDPEAFSQNWPALAIGKYVAEIAKIEIMLAQDCLLDKLTMEKRRYLLKKVVEKYQKIRKHDDVYGINSLEPNVFLMGKLLKVLRSTELDQHLKENKKLDIFLRAGSRLSDDTMRDVVSSAATYLK